LRRWLSGGILGNNFGERPSIREADFGPSA
jgi:hypothetical protein